MRESPVAAHGSPDVPMPLEPSGQSSRGFGGGGGVGVGVGVGTAAALGLAATASFLASSSQPKVSAASTRAVRTFEGFIASDMGRDATLPKPGPSSTAIAASDAGDLHRPLHDAPWPADDPVQDRPWRAHLLHAIGKSWRHKLTRSARRTGSTRPSP